MLITLDQPPLFPKHLETQSLLLTFVNVPTKLRPITYQIYLLLNLSLKNVNRQDL